MAPVPVFVWGNLTPWCLTYIQRHRTSSLSSAEWQLKQIKRAQQLVLLCNTHAKKPQICHLILNKITFTRLPSHKTSASSHRRCEDESANSVGMLWRVGKHGSVNEPTGSGATKRRDVYHLAVGILWLQRFIPPVNDETHYELCRKEESIPDPSCRLLLNWLLCNTETWRQYRMTSLSQTYTQKMYIMFSTLNSCFCLF